MLEQRASETLCRALRAHVQVERHPRVLPEREVAPHGAHRSRPRARADGEALDDSEGGRLVGEVGGSKRQQARVVVVPGVAPGGELRLPDRVGRLHRPPTLEVLAA